MELSTDSATRLAYVDTIQTPFETLGKALDGLTVTVIGAGPAGLLFTKTAVALGAKVVILEKAGDPRLANAGYINRSFNITLDEVGRHVLADETIWKDDAVWLVGRAIHNHTSPGSVDYVDYPETAKIASIPRTTLRKNMVTAAIAQGGEIRFHSKVTDMDPSSGEVKYLDEDGKLQRIGADLIVVADGLHSMGDEFRAKLYGEEKGVEVDPRSYISAILKPGEHDDLSLSYIHFWQETVSDSFTLGLPVRDGSVVLLMDSAFRDVAKHDTHPFPTSKMAQERLAREFPQLMAAAPELYKQLPSRVRAHFSSKVVSSYRIGDRAVLVGDSACVFPPWAGIGANSAMYAASSLVYQLVHAGNQEEALSIYESQQRFLAPQMVSLAEGLGKIFNSSVTSKPTQSNDSGLALMIRDARRQAGQID